MSSAYYVDPTHIFIIPNGVRLKFWLQPDLEDKEELAYHIQTRGGIVLEAENEANFILVDPNMPLFEETCVHAQEEEALQSTPVVGWDWIHLCCNEEKVLPWLEQAYNVPGHQSGESQSEYELRIITELEDRDQLMNEAIVAVTCAKMFPHRDLLNLGKQLEDMRIERAKEIYKEEGRAWVEIGKRKKKQGRPKKNKNDKGSNKLQRLRSASVLAPRRANSVFTGAAMKKTTLNTTEKRIAWDAVGKISAKLWDRPPMEILRSVYRDLALKFPGHAHRSFSIYFASRTSRFNSIISEAQEKGRRWKGKGKEREQYFSASEGSEVLDSRYEMDVDEEPATLISPARQSNLGESSKNSAILKWRNLAEPSHKEDGSVRSQLRSYAAANTPQQRIQQFSSSDEEESHQSFPSAYGETARPSSRKVLRRWTREEIRTLYSCVEKLIIKEKKENRRMSRMTMAKIIHANVPELKNRTVYAIMKALEKDKMVSDLRGKTNSGNVKAKEIASRTRSTGHSVGDNRMYADSDNDINSPEPVERHPMRDTNRKRPRSTNSGQSRKNTGAKRRRKEKGYGAVESTEYARSSVDADSLVEVERITQPNEPFAAISISRRTGKPKLTTSALDQISSSDSGRTTRENVFARHGRPPSPSRSPEILYRSGDDERSWRSSDDYESPPPVIISHRQPIASSSAIQRQPPMPNIRQSRTTAPVQERHVSKRRNVIFAPNTFHRANDRNRHYPLSSPNTTTSSAMNSPVRPRNHPTPSHSSWSGFGGNIYEGFSSSDDDFTSRTLHERTNSSFRNLSPSVHRRRPREEIGDRPPRVRNPNYSSSQRSLPSRRQWIPEISTSSRDKGVVVVVVDSD